MFFIFIMVELICFILGIKLFEVNMQMEGWIAIGVGIALFFIMLVYYIRKKKGKSCDMDWPYFDCDFIDCGIDGHGLDCDCGGIDCV